MLDIMEDTSLTGAKPIETPMDPNARSCADQGKLFSSPNSYRRLIGKLNYRRFAIFGKFNYL